MSKRTPEQQARHNQRRREIKQQGRQGIFTVKYLQVMHPQIYQEVNDFYKQLREKYPKRLNHINTKEFKEFEKKAIKKTINLEAQLNICLMPSQNNEATITEDPPVAMEDLQPEEIEKLIQELRDDPDLMYVFNDITMCETTVETEGSLPIRTPDQEIDNIVTELYNDAEFIEAFTHLGEDLPQLNDNNMLW